MEFSDNFLDLSLHFSRTFCVYITIIHFILSVAIIEDVTG